MTTQILADRLGSGLNEAEKLQIEIALVQHLVNQNLDPKLVPVDADLAEILFGKMSVANPEWKDLPCPFDIWETHAIKHLRKFLLNLKRDDGKPLKAKMDAYKSNTHPPTQQHP